MNKTQWLWLILGLVYVVFFSWYTSFGGPLSADEIEHYMEKMAQYRIGLWMLD